MKKILPLLLLFFLWAPRPAAAAYITGADLHKNCQSSKAAEVLACMNYIAGVIDYHVMMQSLGTAPTTSFCLPATLPIDAAAVTVMKYLQNSPQHGSFIAAPAVVMALHERFPCGAIPPRKKKKR